MANIAPAEHTHRIDLESALDFLNTLHPGHGRTDEQHEADEHLAQPADAAVWFLEHELVHAQERRRLEPLCDARRLIARRSIGDRGLRGAEGSARHEGSIGGPDPLGNEKPHTRA